MSAITNRILAVVLALGPAAGMLAVDGASAGASALPVASAPAAPARPANTSRVELSPVRRTVALGTRIALHSHLTASGAPMAGRRLAYDVRRHDGSWQYLTSVLTNADGRAALVRMQSSSNVYRVRYLGEAGHPAASSPWSYVSVTTLSFGQRVVAEAARHAGAPYRYGATGPGAFDCSGFTRYVFSRLGRTLPHNSAQQYAASRHIAPKDMRPGDLVFMGANGSIHHVGIYAGNGKFWHAPQTGETVRLAPLPSAFRVGRVA